MSASKPPSDDLQGIASAAQPSSPPPPNGAKKKPAYVSALTVELNAKEKPDYTAPIAIGIFSGVITAVVVSLLISSKVPEYVVPTPILPQGPTHNDIGVAAPPKNTAGPPPLDSATLQQTTAINQLPLAIKAAKAVDATELATVYAENEVAADAQYKGKIVEVRGTVHNVENEMDLAPTGDNLNHPCVVLAQFVNGWRTVRCFFTGDTPTDLAKLRPGDGVVVEGVCDGWTFDTVKMRRCTLVSQTAPTTQP